MGLFTIAVLNQPHLRGNRITLANDLAYSFNYMGRRPIIVNGSLYGPEPELELYSLDAKINTIKKREEEYGILIIDGIRGFTGLMSVAIEHADFILIPIERAWYLAAEIKHLVDYIRVKEQFTTTKIPAAFVITKSEKRDKVSKKFIDYLERHYGITVLRSHFAKNHGICYEIREEITLMYDLHNEKQRKKVLEEIMAEEMDTITIRIPSSLKDKIKMEALLRRTTVTNIIIDYFNEIVSNKR